MPSSPAGPPAVSHLPVRSPGAANPPAAARPAAGLRPGQPEPHQPEPGQPEPGHRAGHHGFGLALILTAAFMVVLDFSIVNVALPSIQHELGFSPAAVQWVVTGYAIAFAGLLILGGRAADLFGRRRMFIAGLILFTLASLAGGLAHDAVLLVAARVLQGAGAAIVAPAALSLITTGFAEGPQRNKALGLYGATSSLGFVAGQVLGGALVQFTSWRAVFLVNVPVGVLAALLAPRLLAESRLGQVGRRLDAGGAALITAAVALAVFAVSESGHAALSSPLVLAAAALAVCSAAAFLAVERRHPDPLIRPDLMRLPDLRRAGLVNVLLGLWNAGEMIVLSIYLQQVLHDSPLATGLIVAPQGVIGFTAGIFGARLARRLGVRRVLVLTGAVATAGFAVMTQLPAHGHYSLLFLALMPVGFGTAGTAFGTLVTASTGMADAEQGLVGGVVNTSRQVGAAIGAALLPAVAEAANGGSIAGPAGDRAAMLTAGIAAAAATVIALRAAGRVRPGRLRFRLTWRRYDGRKPAAAVRRLASCGRYRSGGRATPKEQLCQRNHQPTRNPSSPTAARP